MIEELIRIEDAVMALNEDVAWLESEGVPQDRADGKRGRVMDDVISRQAAIDGGNDGIIQLQQGDCLELMKNIPDGSVDLVLTDPPYLCDYSRHDSKSRFAKKIANDENNSANEGMIERYLQECFRIMKDDTAIYCFCNYKKIDFFKQQIEKAGFNLKNIIIWDKQRNGMGDLSTTFGYSYEFIIFASKGQPKIRGKRISDVWQFARVKPKEQTHQNQKPIDLLKQAIEKSSDEGGVVFDGFMGSGSTGVACVNLKRNFIGMELKEEYFKIAEERINNARLNQQTGGDWIITGVHGEPYPCKPDIFEETYEEVEE